MASATLYYGGTSSSPKVITSSSGTTKTFSPTTGSDLIIYVRYQLEYYNSGINGYIKSLNLQAYRPHDGSINSMTLGITTSSQGISKSNNGSQGSSTISVGDLGSSFAYNNISTSSDSPSTLIKFVQNSNGYKQGSAVETLQITPSANITIYGNGSPAYLKLVETFNLTTQKLIFTAKYFKEGELIDTRTGQYDKSFTTLPQQKRSGKFTIDYVSSGTNNGKTSSPSYTDYSEYGLDDQEVKYSNSTSYTINKDLQLYAHYKDPIPSVTFSSFYTSSKSPYTEKYGYTVDFYRLSGDYPDNKYASKDTTKGSIITTYTFRGWECNKDGKLYGGSEGASSIKLYSDVIFTAKFKGTPSGERVAQKISGIPSKPGYKGFIFKGWYTNPNGNGDQITSSSMYTSNGVGYADGSPVEYKVSFDLNTGTLPQGEQRPASFMKTYGVPVELPTVEPTKVGYEFTGGGNKDGSVTPQKEIMDDRVYNSKYTDTTTGAVTLYANGKYKPNTLKLNYWYNDSAQNSKTDTYTYNIDDGTLKYGAPQPPYTRSGDYVFLGGSTLVPSEGTDTTKVGQGYHGVYNIPPQEIVVGPEKSSINLPLVIETNKLNKLNNGGVTDGYYGIGAKTGKYIMVNDEGKKVSTAYVRVGDQGKVVTGLGAFDDDQWKEEV